MSIKENIQLTQSEQRTISIIRNISMFLIILCHYVSWFPSISWTGQFFNVGVPLFFIISGFLYGTKKILSKRDFFIGRLKKIIIPLYVYYLLMSIILLVFDQGGNYEYLQIIKVILCLQGFCGGNIGNIISSHLWFISYILLCYILTPFLQKFKNRYSICKIIITYLMCMLLINIIILLINKPNFLVWFIGVLSYILSYYIGGKVHKIKYNSTINLYMIIGTIFLLTIRIFAKLFLDIEGVLGNVYSNCIAIDLHCITAFFIFLLLMSICIQYFAKNDLFNIFMSKISKYSYDIYIVHYMFITGVLSIKDKLGNIIIESFVFFIATFLSAILLHKTYELLIIRKI